MKYRCNKCHKIVNRKTQKKRTWIPSFCDATGKPARLYRIKK